MSASVLPNRPTPPVPPPPAPNPTQRVAVILLGVAVTLLALWTLHSFLPALAWAGIFAIAFWPLYCRARRRWPAGRHDVLLPALFTLGIALIFIVPLALAAFQLGREAHALLAWVRETQQSGVPVPDWVGRLPLGGAQAATWWRDNLGQPDALGDLLHRLDRGNAATFGRRLGAEVVHRLVLFGFTLLALFFLFRDGARLAAQMRRVGRRAFGARGERVGEQVVASVHGTVDGLVLVGLGEGALLGVAYALAGVPHPVLLGGLTALLAMVPFGAPVVFVAAGLLLAAKGAVGWAIGVIGFGMVVTFVADHFVRPVLIGGATRLPFLWVLLGILGGVESFGLLGLFLGPAIMAVLVLLWREWADDPAAPA